jgi:uncharacterized protein (DUF3084 family)
LLEDVEALKESVRSEHNQTTEVNERTEEQLALARLIRRGADRDLVQSLKLVQDLTTKLSTAEENWNNLWNSIKSVADLLRSEEDNWKTWGRFVPLIPIRLCDFIKRAAQVCVKNTLA